MWSAEIRCQAKGKTWYRDPANQAAGTAALNPAFTYYRASVFFDFGLTGAQLGGARTYYFDDLAFAP